MSTFKNKIIDIAHETVDLFQKTVELKIQGSRFTFESTRKDGFSITVIADELNQLTNETGLHQVISDDFSEYHLDHLLNQAITKGFDQIILHEKEFQSCPL